MSRYYAYRGACLFPFEAGCTLPESASPVEEPFSPLVILLMRSGRGSRGVFALQAEAELFGPEIPSALLRPLPAAQGPGPSRLPEPVRAILAREGGARSTRHLPAATTCSHASSPRKSARA